MPNLCAYFSGIITVTLPPPSLESATISASFGDSNYNPMWMELGHMDVNFTDGSEKARTDKNNNLFTNQSYKRRIMKA